MADQEVVKLLEEIRDLQKLHIASYKEAVANQQQSIEMQKIAVKRQKMSLLIPIMFLAAILIWLVWSTHPIH